MEIHIDLIPPEDGYFISIELSDKKSIGINNTWTGHFMKKQKIIGNRKPEKEPDASWITLEVIDGKLKKKREAEWVDEGEIDLINNTVWETVEVVDIPKGMDERLMKLSSKIYKNRNNLDSVKDELEELDEFLSERMNIVLDKFSS